MNAKRKTLIGAAVAAALVLGITVLMPDQPAVADAGSKPKPALTVSTVTPQSAELPLHLGANGNVVAWQEASIGAEANGLRLREVRVNVGDVVKRGQVLAVFAAETVTADLAQVQANVAAAEADAADAAINAQRARSLKSTGALSAQQVDQLITAEQTAQARLKAQRAAAEVQRLRLEKTQVLAPDDGVISARMATVGAVVPAGEELFRMVRQSRLEWRAEITSADLAHVHVGDAASLRAPDGSYVTGTVRTVAPTVDPQTRLGLVYVDLPAVSALKAGMFAKGEFKLGSSVALTVPQQAIVMRDGFNYVFRLGADNRVTQQKVQVGRRIGDRVEIVDIDSAVRLVASGTGFLNDGDLVKVVVKPEPDARLADILGPKPAAVKL